MKPLASILLFFPTMVLCMNTMVTLPDFDAISGQGTLSYTGPNSSLPPESATMSIISELTIGDNKDCKGLILKTDEESIVVVAVNESKQVFICPGGKEGCDGEPLDPVEIKENVWKMYVPKFDITYQVEFESDRFVYRIKRRRCLINYRHGCLIPGIGWRDKHVYEFKKINNIDLP
jgi:hypothetical protein